MKLSVPSTISFLLAWALAAPFAASQQEHALLEPDPVLQAAIDEALNPASEEELERSLELLRELGGPGYRELVPQLFYYSEQATTTKGGMAFGVLVDQLRIPDRAIVRALVPLLESGDAGLRKSLGGYLIAFEQRSLHRPPSFAVYRPFLEEAMRMGAPLPPGLVRYLYETHAGTALLLLAGIDDLERRERRAILWAEHVIADVLWKQQHGFLEQHRVEPAAAHELSLLVTHDRWWARLYAARVMVTSPGFREWEAIERLANDGNALVREPAAALLEER